MNILYIVYMKIESTNIYGIANWVARQQKQVYILFLTCDLVKKRSFFQIFCPEKLNVCA